MSLTPIAASLTAGAVASVVTLVVFLGVHHVWIKPIWMVLPPGLLVALLGGLAIGWAQAEVAAALPARPWATLAMFGIILAVLLPGAVLSLTHGPLFDLATATIPAGQGVAVAVRFALELVLTAAVTGACLGAWLGKTSSAVLAMALAGIAFAIGPGHNIPMFGRHPLAIKQFAIVLIVAGSAAATLTESRAWLERYVRPPGDTTNEAR